MTRHDWLALATLAAVTGWVAVWRGVVRAIDRVEHQLDLIAGDETPIGRNEP